MYDVAAGLMGLLSYAAFIWVWLSVRPRGSISVLDLFVILFSLQYGPHAFLPHPARELSLLVPDAYAAYASGLALAYMGLAIGLGIVGTLAGTARLTWPRHFPRDLSERGAQIICFVGVIYIFAFVAIEGFDISRTLNYVRFFSGNSAYSYAELRRELYAESTITGIGSVTRQTSSAILFSVLIYAGAKYRAMRLPCYGISALVFVFCAMQMNKFPFIYYTLVAASVILLMGFDRRGRFITAKLMIGAACGVAGLLAFLFVMYQVQYSSAAAEGLVTTDRLAFRTLYRPFAANHDALQLWFAHYPETFGFIGFSNVAPLTRAFDLPYVSPMTDIPALYTRAMTSFQAGIIGSSYASFGYLGIFVSTLVFGGLLAALCCQQYRMSHRWMMICYVAVVGMNMYFLSSRELHTALLSGGVLSAPLIFWIISVSMAPVTAGRRAMQSNLTRRVPRSRSASVSESRP